MKPPGHTCPAIDRAQSALRRLAWRCANPDHQGITPGEVLADGLKDLEQVREENKQMRAAMANYSRLVGVIEELARELDLANTHGILISPERITEIINRHGGSK
jgi:hypothetical protein